MLGSGEATVLDHAVAAGEHEAERSGHVHAAERRPAEPVVDRLDRDLRGPRRIPDGDVGVGARGRSRPCPARSKMRAGAAQATSTSRSGESGAPSGASVKPIGRRAAMPGRPGRDLAEVADQRQLLLEADVAVVRRERVETPVAQRLVPARAGRRRSAAAASSRSGRRRGPSGRRRRTAGGGGTPRRTRSAPARAPRRSRRATRCPLTCTT